MRSMKLFTIERPKRWEENASLSTSSIIC
jgi:hypothetical protein